MILVKHLSKKIFSAKSNMYKFKTVFDPLLHVTSAVIGSGVLHYNFTIKNSELIGKLQAVLF